MGCRRGTAGSSMRLTVCSSAGMGSRASPAGQCTSGFTESCALSMRAKCLNCWMHGVPESAHGHSGYCRHGMPWCIPSTTCSLCVSFQDRLKPFSWTDAGRHSRLGKHHGRAGTMSVNIFRRMSLNPLSCGVKKGAIRLSLPVPIAGWSTGASTRSRKRCSMRGRSIYRITAGNGRSA